VNEQTCNLNSINYGKIKTVLQYSLQNSRRFIKKYEEIIQSLPELLHKENAYYKLKVQLRS